MVTSMTQSIVFDAPVPPSLFRGRQTIVSAITERLRNNALASCSIVGGPCYGKTSLLRFLASAEANHYFDEKKLIRIYFDAQPLGPRSTEYDFWVGAFRALIGIPRLQQHALLEEKIQKANEGRLDEFDLHDVFDEFGRLESAIVLLVDNFDRILKNDYFWEETDFFHELRMLAQRQPRGVGFVVATSRPLVDYWRPGAASPFMNIFLNLSLVPLAGDDVAAWISLSLENWGLLDAFEDINSVVQEISQGHPLIANWALKICADQWQANKRVDRVVVEQALADPAGPVVIMVRRILEELLPHERRWLDDHLAGQRLQPAPLRSLRRLNAYGLLPPGTFAVEHGA